MSGGYEKYLRRAIGRLAAHPDVAAVSLVVHTALRERVLAAMRSSDGPVGVTVVDRFVHPILRQASSEFAKHLESFRPSVVFIPNSRFMATTRWPLVIMVRNMEPLAWRRNADPLKRRLVNKARRHETRIAARSATRVIAVSQFVRSFLIEKWSVPSERVAVVYHGADQEESIEPTRPESLSRREVEAGFVFSAGSITPSRGLEDLLLSTVARPERGRPVVIAGGADPSVPGYAERLRAQAPETVWTGPLTEAEMAWCYKNCSTFVMTSRVEACPNVGLEALSHGCVVVSADNPPLPEIFGDAAVYYQAGDVTSLKSQLTRVDAWEKSQRDRASSAARARAAQFTWRGTVDATVGLLKQAAGA